ncbi:unnamed protein product [Sphenostylis stenocarpa]|uniref:Uncharacterized protein n=1 Tax=Sphenostylis stenocarpa TaxID=92480 RepID=A0AA86VBU9_9FABA|nr:unnamed protein product [Sphenostylis stenocarpa]
MDKDQRPLSPLSLQLITNILEKDKVSTAQLDSGVEMQAKNMLRMWQDSAPKRQPSLKNAE